MKFCSKRINKLFLGVIIMLLLLSTTEVKANIICNDGTVSASCTSCHQGCCSRHGGCSYGYSGSSSSSSSFSSYAVPVIVKKKSSNNKIKSIVINDKRITVKRKMIYTTTNSTASISITLKSKKARSDYDTYMFLNHGNNTQKIIITAENGNKRTYYLTIKQISNDTSIKSITINNESVPVSIMRYSTKDKNININVVTKDRFAKAVYKENLVINQPETETKIIVIAENDDRKEYTLTIKKIEEDPLADYVAGVTTITGIGAAAAGGIYYGTKRKKSNKINKAVTSFKCAKCNREINHDDMYCEYCGNRLHL